jgi:hypothetical protein
MPSRARMPTAWETLRTKAAKTGRTESHGARAAFANPFPGDILPAQVGQVYDYPADLDGSGQNVAVFALNGAGGQDSGLR